MKIAVQLRDVSKTYKMGASRVHALRGIDLEVSQGDFLAIMGASGSGKSTLLNVLGCLDKPTSGNYQLDGEHVDQMDDDGLATVRRTKLGFVFQSFNLMKRSTALENVELPMVYLGVGRQERLDRAKAALEMVGLSKRMHHMPAQMSGGQQQRAALARALVTQPQLLLADEPTGNLDSRTGGEMMDLLTRLQRQYQLTMIMVTHDADIAAFSHRVVILHDGNIVYDRLSPARGGPEIPRLNKLAPSVGEMDETEADEAGPDSSDIRDALLDGPLTSPSLPKHSAPDVRIPEKVFWNL